MSARPELEGGYSRRVLGWVIGIAVVSFLLAIVLSALGPELAPPPSSGTDSFSFSAIGHRGLVELLRAEGLTVVSRKSPGGVGAGPRWPLVLAEPGGRSDGAARFQRLVAEARTGHGPVVVVLPKWRSLADGEHPGWVSRVAPRSTAEIVSDLRELDPALFASLALSRASAGGEFRCTAETGAAIPVHLGQAQWISPDSGFDSVVSCPDGYLVARRGDVWLIGDPDLLNNHGLAHEENAQAIAGFFTGTLAARGATFDETLHGFTRSDSLLVEAFRFPLWPATFEAALLLGLILWAGMGRFGEPVPATRGLAAGKDALIDNTAALLASGGHLVDSLERYHRQTVQAVAAALALPSGLAEPELLSRLGDLGRRRGVGADPAVLGRRLASLAGRPDSTRQALAIARALHRWRLDMTAGRGAPSEPAQSSGKSK